jgi:hypothetical protein
MTTSACFALDDAELDAASFYCDADFKKMDYETNSG